MLATTHENWRLPIRARKCSWGLLVSWCDTQECSWPFMSTHGHSLAAVSTQEYPRAFICSLVHSWAWCAMTPRALLSVLWALRHIAISTYEPWRHHDTILISTHGCSWVLKSAQTWSLGLRSALEWSRELMNTQVLNWTMTKKCWFLKWPPCSIFPKIQSRFDQMIKIRIF